MPGTGPGEFHWPTGITVDSAGLIYVIDAGNQRVQAFRPQRQKRLETPLTR
jgi:sugar lactone lactonase YvrE